jgi:hypothetical protein
VLAPLASPRVRPFCILRNFVRLGESIDMVRYL